MESKLLLVIALLNILPYTVSPSEQTVQTPETESRGYVFELENSLISGVLAIPFFIINRYIKTHSRLPFGQYSGSIQPYYPVVSDIIIDNLLANILCFLYLKPEQMKQQDYDPEVFAKELLSHPDFDDIVTKYAVVLEKEESMAAYSFMRGYYRKYCFMSWQLAISSFVINTCLNAKLDVVYTSPYYLAANDIIIKNIFVAHVFLALSKSSSSRAAIGVSSDNPRSLFIHALYHEIGHLAAGHHYIGNVLSADDIKALEQFKHYSNIGKQLLVTAHEPHSLIVSYLQHKILEMKDDYLGDSQSREAHADIFAIEHLWKHNTIDIIINNIYHTLFVQDIELRGADKEWEHPSMLNRVLCVVGFLAEKGVDVIDLLHKLENSQTPSPILQKRKDFLTGYLANIAKH